MKIILINPIPETLEEGVKNNIPLGLLSIATYIRKKTKYDIKIIDCLVENDYLSLIKKEVINAQIVGFSVMSSAVPNSVFLIGEVKKINKKAKIVFGGIHPTLFPEQTLSSNLVDFIVIGEGEYAFLDIIKQVNSKSKKKIAGAGFKSDNKLIIDHKKRIFNPNDIEVYSFNLLNQKVFKDAIIPLNTSRGCPHRCSFCVNVVTSNRMWRGMSVENVLKNIKSLYVKGIRTLYFRDENFFVNRKRAEEIFKGIIKEDWDLKIRMTCRVNYFTNGLIDDELLKIMKRVGVFQILFGVESGSKDVISILRKDITNEDVTKSVEMLKRYKISGAYSFMVGVPGEKHKDMIKTANLIKKISRMYQGFYSVKSNGKLIDAGPYLQIFGPQVFRPYPGGELYATCKNEYGWKDPVSLEECVKFFKEFKRYPVENYPWIKNPKTVVAFQFYLNSGRLTILDFLRKIISPKYSLKLRLMFSVLYPFAKIRCLLNWYDLPFEYLLGKKLGLIDRFES